MKTKLLIVPFLLVTGMVFGQEEAIQIEVLKRMNNEFKKEKETFDKLNNDFNDLSKEISLDSVQSISEKLKTKKDEILTIKKDLDSIYKIALNYESYYINEKILSSNATDTLLVDIKKYNPKMILNETSKKTKIVSYFGENETIDHEILKDKSGKEIEVIKKVLSTEGDKNYFGDITIPKDGEEFYFYNWDKGSLSDKKFKFKKIDIEIRDGYFYDIVAHVEDKHGNIHIYTNQVGISILYYSHSGKRKFLYYTHSQKKNATANDRYTDNELSKLYIKLSDIFSYNYNIGKHYIPLEMTVKLPDEIKDNSDSNVKYEIRQETDLEKIVELRAYTDFLALFGEEENGLVQIEGKANFYIFPNPVRMLGSKRYLGQVEFLPTISPFVNYSRFEKGNRYVGAGTNTFAIDNGTGELNFERGLALIEKRFLSMGLEGDIFKWQHKNAPLKISLYAFGNYNLTEVDFTKNASEQITDDERDIRSLKSFGYGTGIHFSVKRFNNFGFDYRIEMSEYDYNNHNSYDEIKTVPKTLVLRNEAEIFYYPNGNPNSSIFTRLITYNYRGRTNNQAFYQFQFGYKFAIGNRTVSK